MHTTSTDGTERIKLSSGEKNYDSRLRQSMAQKAEHRADESRY